MPDLSVIFIGIGNPVPTFIKNRILQLDETGEIKLFVIVPNDSRKEITLKNGIILSELPVCFNLKYTILPLIWQSLLFFPRAIKLWSSLGYYSFKIRLRSFIKYNSLVRINKIDVIHFQWIVSSEEINWAGRFFKAPVIISARGSQVTIYPITIPGYADKIRMSLKAADHIHAVSKSMAQACVGFGIEPYKIFVNYNGIDTRKFTCKNREVKISSNEELRLISTGTLMWRKGYLWQILLVKKLTDRGLKVKLEIIGDGPDRQGLEYTVKRLDIDGTVVLAGQMGHDDVIKHLQESDIYISTSAAEGLSNSVLEAVASGLPVIAFECEGMNEVIEDGFNGFIIPFGDIDTMAEKIIILNNEKILLNTLGNNGFRLASEKFDSGEMVIKMVDFYKKIRKTYE